MAKTTYRVELVRKKDNKVTRTFTGTETKEMNAETAARVQNDLMRTVDTTHYKVRVVEQEE